VLDAEQELLNSKVSLVIAQRDYVVAEYNLLAAIGRLTVSTLPVTNIIYDPKENYQQVNRRWRGGDINHPELDSRGLHHWDDIIVRRN
jgi:outer membrane protein